jgi:hypothetical protein
LLYIVVAGGCWRYLAVLVLDRRQCIRPKYPREIALAVMAALSPVLNLNVPS